ncbi:hypothetical protein EYR41_006081 [Orbilia oligospora]|uniref:Uncharacterized protein n=1 Tax=Orbilia oligospora TaxID=2813651 RepID=A0A8H2E636_ORBOL|nr:hypothetical protein EYR41_006081 [Orbilia oligospora]
MDSKHIPNTTANTLVNQNSIPCWLHSHKEDFTEQVKLLRDSKDNFGMIVETLVEGIKELRDMKPGTEMQDRIGNLIATSRRYYRYLAVASPFLMCSCELEEDKTLARFYFNRRNEVSEPIDDAYAVFLQHFKGKHDCLGDPTNMSQAADVPGPDLHADANLEDFQTCSILFGDLVYEATGRRPVLGNCQ